MTYARAFPWPLTVVSGSEVGDGTQYPIQTGEEQTHDIYWKTQFLSIEGTLSCSQGDNGSVTLAFGGGSLARAERPHDLVFPTNGTVVGTGTSGNFSSGATFGFEPASAAILHDFRQQWLKVTISGTIGTTVSSGFTSIDFSSIETQGSTQVGYCRFEGFRIPIFAELPSGATMTADMDVTRFDFATT
jgi:hypothetical protein